ncbi:MAG: acetate uptake transporter [Desulfuromonadaceae bacterium]|nr:acetate uptake transporter [Geobacteraceae bacterium]
MRSDSIQPEVPTPTPVVKPFHVKWPATTLLEQTLKRRPDFHADVHSISATAGDEQSTAYLIRDTTANPVPLGLIGLGMSILLLNFHFAGFIPMDAMIVGMGTFCGGVEQVMVGIMAWKKNNIFAATTFSSLGLFWLSLVAIILSPSLGMGKASPAAMGFYLSIWALFTAGIFLASFRRSRAIRVVFGLLLTFFILLAAGHASSSPILIHIAGYAGILSGISAIYTGLAHVMNELFHKTLLPLGVQHS